jgi:hypothetical protein
MHLRKPRESHKIMGEAKLKKGWSGEKRIRLMSRVIFCSVHRESKLQGAK